MSIPKDFSKKYSIPTDGKTSEKQIFVKGKYRFSILTSRLLRVEYEKSGNFCDEPTQAVLFRNIGKPEWKVSEEGKNIIISTKDTVFNFAFNYTTIRCH